MPRCSLGSSLNYDDKAANRSPSLGRSRGLDFESFPYGYYNIIINVKQKRGQKPPFFNAALDYSINNSSLPGTPFIASASSKPGFRLVITGHSLARRAFKAIKCCWSAGTSSSAKIASAGHSATHSVQSMHSSGLIAKKFGPSTKQSTGQTSTQSVNLH